MFTAMSDMQIFNYGEYPVRTVLQDGEPWWVLTDVCRVLGLTTPARVAERLDEDEKGVSLTHTPGGPQNMTIINESGLYHIILRSDKPEAKPFRRWVTHEVLPAIRRDGAYSITAQPPCPLKPSSAGDVAQLLRVLRTTMRDNYQTSEAISQTMELICSQFGISLPDSFVRKLPPYIDGGFTDWRPSED